MIERIFMWYMVLCHGSRLHIHIFALAAGWCASNAAMISVNGDANLNRCVCVCFTHSWAIPSNHCTSNFHWKFWSFFDLVVCCSYTWFIPRLSRLLSKNGQYVCTQTRNIRACFCHLTHGVQNCKSPIKMTHMNHGL